MAIYAADGNDEHWSFKISVVSLLYGESSLEEISEQFRPKKVRNKSPICVWLHIPQNNVSQSGNVKNLY